MTLTHSQQSIVKSSASDILVAAGPGSGKTAVLIARIVRCIDSGVPPSDIVAITYTNSAADEIRCRVLEASKVELGYVGTIHGYLLRLIRQHVPGMQRVAVIDEEQAAALLQECARDLRYRGTKEELSYAATEAAVLVLCEFQNRMKRYGVLSFHEILNLGEAAVPESKPVHLFVDEYQDVTDQIHRIVQRMAGTKFCTGDPDQAIFGWLGGNVGNMVGLTRSTEFETHRLEDNFRCGDAICAAAQRLIEHNRNRINKVTRSATKTAGDVQVWQIETELAEYTKIALALAELPTDKTAAVLARTNFIAEQITKTLEAAGIQVRARQKLKHPIDWNVCRKLVALVQNPESDYLAHWFLEYTQGKRQADVAQMGAASLATSINQFKLKIPADISAAQIPDFLARAAISNESISRVRKAIETLPPDGDVNDLALALGAEDLHSTETGDGVFVGTVHASKGQQFDWVFIAGMDDGVFPSNKKGASLEEERRLLFVGITRARERCVLSTAGTRRVGHWERRAEPATPSPFLLEL